jgi:multiple sugar transport system permease protein
VYICLVVGAALLLALYLSTTDALAGSLTGRSVGLGNFSQALADATTLRSARNTVLVAVTSQILATGLGLVLAAFLARPFRGRLFLLFLIMLPWAAPVALGALGWRWMFDSLFSVLNWGLRTARVLGADDNPQWLADPTLAMVSIIVVETWRSLPFATVVLLAGISGLPPELDDAARLDGAEGWRKWRYVTLPLLGPTIAVATLIGMIFAASGMAIVQVLTGGGPVNSTHVLSSWAFQVGIVSGQVGAGAAVALLALPLLVVATVFVLRFVGRAERIL